MEDKRYSEEGINDFLSELLNGKRFNDSKEEGIVKLAIDTGFESLSEKQQFVFKQALSHYVVDECSRCGLEIPWSEMSATEDNGDLCGWCQQVGSKEN